MKENTTLKDMAEYLRMIRRVVWNSNLVRILRLILLHLYQLGVKLVQCLVRYRLPDLRQGAGRVADLGVILKDRKIDRILVITSTGLVEKDVIQPALDSMKAAELDFHVEAIPHKNPTEEDVQNCVNAYKDRHREALVAIGGQSRIDCAKVTAARIARPGLPLDQMVGFRTVCRKVPPIVAVPTSPGSGAEASDEAVFTGLRDGQKRIIRDRSLMPQCAILDPKLMERAPATTIAQAGMVAICHVVEGWLNRRYCTRIEKSMAVEAIRRLKKSLVRACKDPTDMDAMLDVQYAGVLGARIANRCGHGYTDALAHAIEKFYGVPHGTAVAVILPNVLRKYEGKGRKRLGELAAACDFCTTVSEDAGLFLPRWIEMIRVDMEMKTKFKDLRDSDFQEIVRMTMRELLPWYPVPEIWDWETFHGLLQSLQE